MTGGARAAIGIALLAVAWILAVPPFGGVDEADHHTRVQGVASGTFVGTPARPPSASLTPLQVPWVTQTSRAVHVAAGRSSAGSGCFAHDARIGAACTRGMPGNPRGDTEVTPVGTYEPLPYLLPAAVARVAGTPGASLRWERFASVVPVLALLAAAVLLAAGSLWLLTGVLLATSPAVLMVAGSVGGSGLEIAAAIALATALLAPAVAGAPPRRALAVGVAAAIALVGARSLGPLWLLLVGACCAPLAWRWVAALPRRAQVVSATTIGAAVVAQRVWEGTYGAHLPRFDATPAGESLRAGVRKLPALGQQAVAATGYLDWVAPPLLAVAWLAAVALPVVLVLRAGARGQRMHVLVVGALALAIEPLMFATAVRFTGFPVQARHVLPLLACVPLVAAAVCARARLAAAAGRWLPALLGILQFVLLVLVARRYAVGVDGPTWFIGKGWSPPGGWVPVLAAGATGAWLIATAPRGASGAQRR